MKKISLFVLFTLIFSEIFSYNKLALEYLLKNKKVKSNKPEDLDFSFAVISNIDLSDCDLSYANFSESCFNNVKLQRSNFSYATGGFMKECDLTDSIFCHSKNFKFLNCNGLRSDFSFASIKDIEKSNFDYSVFYKSTIIETLNSSSFRYSDFGSFKFNDKPKHAKQFIYYSVDFSFSNMSDAKLYMISDYDFGAMTLHNVDLRGVRFSGELQNHFLRRGIRFDSEQGLFVPFNK